MCVQEKEDLYAGYVKGDDALTYREQLFQAFNVLKFFNGNSGTLKIPFECTPKTKKIHRLKEIGLYKYIWYCENPTKPGRKCGKCASCASHRSALWKIGEGLV